MLLGKVWGSTELLLTSPFFEVHRLIIRPNAKCSMHKHERKHNAFYVLEGVLFIDVEKNDYKLTDVTELRVGEMTAVAPGEFHRFRTEGEPCEALEMYYFEALDADIVRRDVGSADAL